MTTKQIIGHKTDGTTEIRGTFEASPDVLSPDQVLDLLPASVVKAIKDSTDAAVVARYEAFKLKPKWDHSEGESLFADLVGAGLMTQAQSDAIVWPDE